MAGLTEYVDWVELVVWTVLALVAARVWREHRSRSSTWLALTFAALAAVVVVARFLPEPEGPVIEATILIRIVLALLWIFPYLLYRFFTSMVVPRRREWLFANVITAVAVTWTLLVSSYPAPGRPRPGWLLAFTLVIVVEWVFLLTRVSWGLWRAAHGQPSATRKRMWMMAVGALTLAGVVIVSALVPKGPEPTMPRIIVRVMGLLSGPLFLFSFAPPRMLRVQWRQPQENALRDMQIGLVRAISRAEIADAWLPRVTALVGGRGAVLYDIDRTVFAIDNLSLAEAEAQRGLLPEDVPKYEPVESGSSRILAMDNGWLSVSVGPFTPFFGTDELKMLSASAVVADLALGRTKMFELERKSREAMRDFVAIASHDLRTPVTVIQGFTQLMRSDWQELGEEQKENFLEAIERRVGHLDRLIRDLLTVSKLDVEEIEVFREPVDVDQVAHEVVSATGTDFSVRSEGRTSALADPEHIARMVQNYASNAMIYGRPPYSVEVVGDGRWVTVRVRDAGVGVPEDFIPRLFGKFARLDKKKSKAVQGTGLGLSIVRGLAKGNGGEAWYEPNKPGGACFAFRVPSADEVAHSEATVA